MSAAIELTNFRSNAHAQVVPQAKKKIIIKKYTFSCGDVVYLPEGAPVTHNCKRKPQVYLLDERYEKLARQLKEYQQRSGPTLYDDFRSSFTDKELKYILGQI
jgi:hypothetical protein